MTLHRWAIAIAAVTLVIARAASADPARQEGGHQALERDATQALHRRTSLTRARRAQFESLVNEAARRHRVRAELLHVIIEVESA